MEACYTAAMVPGSGEELAILAALMLTIGRVTTEISEHFAGSIKGDVGVHVGAH